MLVRNPDFESLLSTLRSAVSAASSLREVLAAGVYCIGSSLSASAAFVVRASDKVPELEFVHSWRAPEAEELDQNRSLSFVRVAVASALGAKACMHWSRADLGSEVLFADDAKALGFSHVSVLPVNSESRNPLVLILCEDSIGREFSSDTVAFASMYAEELAEQVERVSQREQLKLLQARVDALAEEAVEALIHVDLQGRVLFVSPRFERIFSYSERGLLGSRIYGLVQLLVCEEDVFEFHRCIDCVLSGEEVERDLQFTGRGKGGQIGPVFSAKFKTLLDREGRNIGAQIAISEGSLLSVDAPIATGGELSFERLVHHSQALMFFLDRNFGLAYANQKFLDTFSSIKPRDRGPWGHIWTELLPAEQREHVNGICSKAKSERAAFELEFSIPGVGNNQKFSFFARIAPVYDKTRSLIGWDGFAIDISQRIDAQHALERQGKKVRALYTVAAAIRGYLDPANIASRGLATLCDATGADAGLCFLTQPDRGIDLKLAAHHGLSVSYTSRLSAGEDELALLNHVAENGKPLVVPDLERDSRASESLVKNEGQLSSVVVPITVDDQVLGVLTLFSKQKARFAGGDVMLVAAAANQIGLAARQAFLFDAYRHQTRNLAALYRISHELSRNLPPQELFQFAFDVMREELGLKRLWLGLLNEPGTRIVGHAAFGPGWKRQLVQLSIDVSDAEHPVARVVAQRKPVVIENAGDVLKEFGDRRVLSKMSIDSVTLVPMISGGQVLGVLAVQPPIGEPALSDDDLSLLMSLGNEVASNVLANRLKARIEAGDKMRAAGLLAGGIAHNFNNLLQAVLGQASLLEIQKDDPSRIERAAKIIQEAASKGAVLVRQLLSFAQLENANKELCEIGILARDSVSKFRDSSPAGVQLILDLAQGLPMAMVDPRHVSRIFESLIRNAFDAVGEEGVVQIFSDSVLVDEQSPHYEVPYGRYVRLGVRDTGVGMDEETRRRCFEPFFTTKDVDENTGVGLSGAGLGLAAAYALARRNGGRITVDSRVGQGTLFTVYFPVGEVAEQAVELRELLSKENGTIENNRGGDAKVQSMPSQQGRSVEESV